MLAKIKLIFDFKKGKLMHMKKKDALSQEQARTTSTAATSMRGQLQELTALCGLAALEADAGRLQRACSELCRRAFFL